MPDDKVTQLEKDVVLPVVREYSLALGYRIEVDKDGTERVYRPDGTLATTARREKK